MHSVILFCPHLSRDIARLSARLPDVEVLLGEKTPRGEDGCLEMHKTVVRRAQVLGWDCVCVAEDDCEFTEHFDYRLWCEDADWAQDNGYDVMVGGSTRTYDEKLVRPGIQGRMIEVSSFHSAHFVVYFASGYEKVLKGFQPFDFSLGQLGCRCVLVYPFVAVQRASFSGILQQNVNYVPLYQEHEARLARLMR